MSRPVVASMEAEYRRYKALAEGAVAQLTDDALWETRSASDNPIGTVMSHVGGNLKSRFTDFLTSDGEKPWRDRDAEFDKGRAAREALLARWEDGWTSLFAALEGLTDEHLSGSVSIRGVPLTVAEALHRSLAHTSYHVGQIVYVAKTLRGAAWTWLSIPPGASAAYNQNPAGEKPAGHAAEIEKRVGSSR